MIVVFPFLLARQNFCRHGRCGIFECNDTVVDKFRGGMAGTEFEMLPKRIVNLYVSIGQGQYYYILHVSILQNSFTFFETELWQ